MDLSLSELFDVNKEYNHLRIFDLIRDPDVSQIVINRFDRVFYTSSQGTLQAVDIFNNQASYLQWIDDLLGLTDASVKSLEAARGSVIEGSFLAENTSLYGSIHIVTGNLTRGDPAVTVRKQPQQYITLSEMLNQGVLNVEMMEFLEKAVMGRSNILISGGSGTGKTTMARALSGCIYDPLQRIVTVEDIDELHIAVDRPTAVSLTTYKKYDEHGNIISRVDLEDLVKEALRMRADRIWVGETRGKEAYALVKACNSGHDGSVTTIHADNGRQAVQQLATYVMESGLAEESARTQVAQAFQVVVQMSKVKMGRRVVSEIRELSPSLEGGTSKDALLFSYDYNLNDFVTGSRPGNDLINAWSRYATNTNMFGNY
jgi:pilus assembly protein CpaF